MLYMIGPVSVALKPFNVDKVSRKTEASLAEKGLIGGLPGDEHTGYKQSFTLSGTVLPFRFPGGLSSLEVLHEMCATGIRAMLIRGDGTVLGWCAIESVEENHEHLQADGVGFVVTHSISLKRVPTGGGDAVDFLMSLFG